MCALGWLSKGKTMLIAIAIIFVLGVHSGQGKTTLSVHICVWCEFRSR